MDDSVYGSFMGMVNLCPGVEVIANGDAIETRALVDKCVAMAIHELRSRKVLRFAYDYTYIMLVINQDMVDRHLFFSSPLDFISYLNQLEIDDIPGKTSIYYMMSCTRDRFPEWKFSDRFDNGETLRRNNVAKQFLSAFMRAKRAIAEGFAENIG